MTIRFLRRAYDLLTSAKLALALLIAILGCCLAGVTVVRGARAWELIFSTLWFNGLLLLLAVSSAAAFFSRTWKRKLTMVQVGMILFHVSFAAMLGGIVFNMLFHFDGVLRLTEGETLPNGRLESYDTVEKGRFFDPSRLGGETTLFEMHWNYRVGGQRKGSGYEIGIDGGGGSRTRAVIYVTEYLNHDGVRFFCAKEGYSVLLVMSGKDGAEIYGAHVPLQSFAQADGSYLYATGTSRGAATFPFPPPPDHPRASIFMSYRPNTVKERAGEVTFQIPSADAHGASSPERKGRVAVGEAFDAGEFTLTPREVRYWVGMNVRYDPGLPVILASLCAGLGGMLLTFVGRIRQGRSRARAA